MKVSFTIVNYNRRDELLLTISKTKDYLSGTELDYEIIVVDNASTDGSANAVSAAFPDCVLIQNPVNTGAPAWNLAFARAIGQYFIILDDDSHLVSGLPEALNYLDSQPTVGALALNISGGLYQTGDWIDLMETAGFIGCGAIIRKEMYDRVGGYADWIFLYTNEWEYGIRILEAGYKIIYFENCRVLHRASIVNRTSKRLIVYSVKHELAIIHKYFSKDRMKYFFRVIMNNLKAVKHGDIRYAWYVLTGVREFIKFRSQIVFTPVSEHTQKLFSSILLTMKSPSFYFLTRSLPELKK